ncbi:glycoside hydrolase family 13 protein [Clostridium perfringens]|uniref:Alpha-amylase n=1 Tax=Clostridium perfringens (strain SM101 / Type A) TaxID=289380 RepID=Q0SVV4_CLOPS|nr:alpha-glucosidase [Clostridium perfringens]ABG87811.1 putative oligo-1,6-glucosidase [Clostridium perfringens SM101]EJT5917204.1 alpha-glucosidase [Clostridium perfringens]EJT6135919.1 alpha-glucosidase [Clostridium perfringens]MBP2860450.1 alpha-glucosidase [Clostridium perfringens]MDG6877179.1 Oligo-16-glucosidase [Clostridium perfringens]
MNKKWWKELIAYQIYPKSFMDSNGDGIGDIQGIISKLDYLKDLGIDLIWLCPMYKSPNHDNGYDISDYKDILDEFGTMDDFNELLNEVHNRGMKLIIDLVINHTSHEHPWFIESRSSRDNPKRDWYIWREGKGYEEPNNWESIFKGSAWEFCENSEEYYLHLFAKEQPDLNWENKEVRRELYNMINWWLDKGIDGFRVDAISHIKKEEGLKDMDNPEGLKYVSSFEKHMNVEGINSHLKELKEETFSKYDIVTVGEANGVSANEADHWVAEDEGTFNMIFQFEHLNLWNYEEGQGFDVKAYKDVLTNWQNSLEGKGWNALFIENHDIPRVVSTWGNDKEYLTECAKAFGAIYFLQKGTPFIYQGQELGMTNVKYHSICEYDDVKTINTYNERIESGVSEEIALKEAWVTSRDNSRTPMQWNSSKNAGFTCGKPWIGVNENYKTINVEVEERDENSVLNFYKKLIKLKKSNEALIYGVYDLILEEDENIFAYTRTLNNDKFLIMANLTGENAKYVYEKEKLNSKDLILNNYEVCEHKNLTEFILKPYECRVYKLS